VERGSHANRTSSKVQVTYDNAPEIWHVLAETQPD